MGELYILIGVVLGVVGYGNTSYFTMLIATILIVGGSIVRRMK